MFPLPWGWCQTTICSRGSLGGVLRSMVVLPFILLTLKWDGDTSFSWAVVFIPVWTLGNSWNILGAPIACPLKAISKRQRKGWEPSLRHLPLSSIFFAMTMSHKIPQKAWTEMDRMAIYSTVSTHMKGCYVSLGCWSSSGPIEFIQRFNGTVTVSGCSAGNQMSIMTSIYDWFHHFFVEAPVDSHGLYGPGCPDMPRRSNVQGSSSWWSCNFVGSVGSRVGTRWL